MSQQLDRTPPLGVVKAKRPGQVKGSTQLRIQRRMREVQTLIDQGYAFQEILDQLDLSSGQLRFVFNKLDQPVRHTTEGVRPRPRGYYELKSLFVVWALYRQGYSIGYIAKTLALSTWPHYPPVHRRLRLIKKLFGPQALKKSCVSLKKACTKTGVKDEKTIENWCLTGRIAGWRRVDRNRIVLTREGFAELSALLDKSKCENPECNNLIVKGMRRRRTCSPACHQRLRSLEKGARGYYLNPGKTVHHPDSWQAELEKALASHQLLEEEQWLRMRDVVNETGLSRIQIIWLTRTGLLAAHDSKRTHP
ncbi:MAG TPA: hypothetical protein VLE93_02335 [Candidatus Saccharimonadales bacterium]|nr:hypothetical protein [Candidatus Saccharimonadales bacterium]